MKSCVYHNFTILFEIIENISSPSIKSRICDHTTLLICMRRGDSDLVAALAKNFCKYHSSSIFTGIIDKPSDVLHVALLWKLVCCSVFGDFGEMF